MAARRRDRLARRQIEIITDIGLLEKVAGERVSQRDVCDNERQGTGCSKIVQTKAARIVDYVVGSASRRLARRQEDILEGIFGIAKVVDVDLGCPNDQWWHGGKLHTNIHSHEIQNTSAEDTKEENAVIMRITTELHNRGMSHNAFNFKRVADDYYDKALDARAQILGAQSVRQLCKSIVMRNTKYKVSASIDEQNKASVWDSEYVIVVIQYCTRLNSDKVKTMMHKMGTLGKPRKQFNYQLCDETTSLRLTGYGHNAVSCVSTSEKLPIILTDRILENNEFWMGGGEVDLKLAVNTEAFCEAFKDVLIVADVAYDTKS